MRALRMHHVTDLTVDPAPLRVDEIDDPVAGDGELLIDVSVCGVCHTELDEIEGRTPPPRLPMTPGHQVVGYVAARGAGVTRFDVGDRVGVAWIHSACGRCAFCRSGRENLCPDFRATGRDAPGGYAERMVVREDFAHELPTRLDDATVAPLLCAGAIGDRSLELTEIENGQALGLAGFGASARLVFRLVRALYPDTSIAVFARHPDTHASARRAGAVWAGPHDATPPQRLDAIIDTTPAWVPVLEALRHLKPGGRLVINAIRKEDRDSDALSTLDYGEQLWMEKEIRSVANVTRDDVRRFLERAARFGLETEVEEIPWLQANRALVDLRRRAGERPKVLRVR